MTSRCFLFTGGGTGGHVSPALAIAEGIRSRHPDAHFVYVGVYGKAEARMVPKHWSTELDEGLASIRFVRSKGYTGMNLGLLSFMFNVSLGIFSSIFILLSARPAAIIATGGYVSAPILFAAFLLKKMKIIRSKIFIHEQNAVLGRMNKLGVSFADKVGTSFPGVDVPKSKKAFVGYPVRRSVVVPTADDRLKLRNEARRALGIAADAKVIFAFGGSQGARTINRAIVRSLPLLLSDPSVVVIHGTGKQLVGNQYNGMADSQQELERVREHLPADLDHRYRPTDFFDNMGQLYAASDVVLCRSGAGSLIEVCANAACAVTIPKANVPGDHQAENARTLREVSAIEVVFESVDLASEETVESVDPANLVKILRELLANPQRRAQISSRAREMYSSETTDQCAQIIDALLGEADYPELRPEPEISSDRVLGCSTNQLVNLLRWVHDGKVMLTDSEMRNALYKIDAYLPIRKSEAPLAGTTPARACRMIGYGGFVERLPVLHRFATDRTHYPIVRRDACQAIGLLLSAQDKSIDVLLEALSDPYYETVVQALKALDAILEHRHQAVAHRIADIARVVEPCIEHKKFDIVQSAIAVMSLVIDDYDSYETLIKRHFFHPNWQVRKTIISSLYRLKRRGILTESQISNKDSGILRKILQTSNGFNMVFELKQEIRDYAQEDARDEVVSRLRSLLETADRAKLESLAELAKEENLDLVLADALQTVTEVG